MIHPGSERVYIQLDRVYISYIMILKAHRERDRVSVLILPITMDIVESWMSHVSTCSSDTPSCNGREASAGSYRDVKIFGFTAFINRYHVRCPGVHAVNPLGGLGRCGIDFSIGGTFFCRLHAPIGAHKPACSPCSHDGHHSHCSQLHPNTQFRVVHPSSYRRSPDIPENQEYL